MIVGIGPERVSYAVVVAVITRSEGDISTDAPADGAGSANGMA